MNLKMIFLAALVSATCAACSGPPQDSAPGHLHITAGPQTPHTVGTFDAATNAMVAKKGQVGTLMYGPYAKLPAGHYQVTFHVTAESDSDGMEVGAVDVNGFTIAVNSNDLASAPLKASHGEQAIKLTFDASNPEFSYEFRVTANGNGDRVTVPSVDVDKL
jgi:hypothetical protein